MTDEIEQELEILAGLIDQLDSKIDEMKAKDERTEQGVHLLQEPKMHE